MDSPHDMDDWEILGSEILADTYELVNEIGFDNVRMMWESALKTSLDHRGTIMLVYQGEVLDAHLAVTDRVNAWLSKVPVVRSRAPHVHAFDSERRLLAILNNTPHIPASAPDDAPTLDPGEYRRWLRDARLKGQRSKDKEASRERNVRWHQMRQDPHHDPEDWADFQRRKRDDKAQHHRAGRDEPINSIYGNMPSVGPSGSTTTTPSRSKVSIPSTPAVPCGLSDATSFISCLQEYQTSWFEPPR
ncbi:hypothetical protein EDD18DRAFT_1468249 [Armillaria luteobubalina]|uniref:Uncharacterized protein n=1 Tax=Armillaria luteobubalina TaxID=153913 RepID=A0AA39PBF3_9AGAR|nr:hypothetical protein EDD18DRAFT_1468249 [Armillaria luteobubalina]